MTISCNNGAVGALVTFQQSYDVFETFLTTFRDYKQTKARQTFVDVSKPVALIGENQTDNNKSRKASEQVHYFHAEVKGRERER